MIPRALPPLWLATPSRYAGLSPAAARWVLAALAVLLLATVALAAPGPAGGDTTWYAGLVEGVRSGGDYYTAAADALRSDGDGLHSIPLPTLTMVEATLPALVTAALLYTLALATMLAWYDRLRPALRGRVSQAAIALLFGMGSLGCWRVELIAMPQVWAGLLLALSLARSERPVEAIGWGLAAALIRETAGLYLLVMAAIAWATGRRREAMRWAGVLAVLLLVVAAHVHAIAAIPLGGVATGWAGPGVGAVVRVSALGLLPPWLGAMSAALAWCGWTAWRDALGVRVAAVVAALLLAVGVTGPDDALLVAPVLLIGLAFAPDGLRDLLARALDTRRIVVRRVTP